MRNDVLMAAGLLLALVIGYWLLHYSHRSAPSVSRPAAAATAVAGGDELIRQDFVSAAGAMKVAIAEFYVNRGAMPKDNAEAGLPAPSEYVGQSLRSATVTADGNIEFEFDGKSGLDGGRIRLLTDVVHANAMGVQWKCETGDYPDIARVVPNCAYVPR